MGRIKIPHAYLWLGDLCHIDVAFMLKFVITVGFYYDTLEPVMVRRLQPSSPPANKRGRWTLSANSPIGISATAYSTFSSHDMPFIIALSDICLDLQEDNAKKYPDKSHDSMMHLHQPRHVILNGVGQ